MIRFAGREDFDSIHQVINESAQAYQGVIPEDQWHDPYMSESELVQDLESGVRFFLCEEEGELLGVMGIQQIREVTLVRHSYVRTAYRRRGIGERLLAHLRDRKESPLLVGTWKAAYWAIDFYRKNGFELVPPEKKDRLLRLYWDISQGQIEASVVLREGPSEVKDRP